MQTREEKLQKKRDWNKKNWKKYTKKTLVTTKAWQKLNPEKVRSASERAKKNNPERNLWNNAKCRAKKRGIEFTITKEDIVIPEFCPYLEVKLDSWGIKDFCPSLDRIDNTKGYTKDNIQVISTKANRMKNTASLEELKTFARNIMRFT